MQIAGQIVKLINSVSNLNKLIIGDRWSTMKMMTSMKAIKPKTQVLPG